MNDYYKHIDLEEVSERVRNFLLYAPDYPVEILNVLRQDFGLNKTDVIADIGSGLGFLTNLFINESDDIFMIENQEDYLKVIKSVYKQYPKVKIYENTAEKTGLARESIDLIMLGNVFHHYAPKPIKQEFQRIIKPNGLVSLIWHQKNIEIGLQRDYEKVLEQNIPNYKNLSETHINLKSIDNFFDPYPFHYQKFPNFIIYDLDGLKGHFLSSSLIHKNDDTNMQAVLKELEKIFNIHQQFGKIRFDYNTLIFIGKIK